MGTTARIRIDLVWRNGGFLGWAKHILSVDPSTNDGSGLRGPRLRPDTMVSLPIGSVLLVVSPDKSDDVVRLRADVRVVVEDSEDMNRAAPMVATGDWDEEFSAIKTACEKALREQRAKPASSLDGVSDTDLIAAAQNRGLVIFQHKPQAVSSHPMGRREIVVRLCEISRELGNAMYALDEIDAVGIDTMWMGELYNLAGRIGDAREEINEAMETVEAIACLQVNYETSPEGFRHGIFD